MAIAIIAKWGKREEQVDVAQSLEEAGKLTIQYKNLYGAGCKVFSRPLRKRHKRQEVAF